ncbi:Ger(x)C family spore germination protein [Paenibacillus sp. FJAT-27812]|uniref:Ger(x)C family spore germination protein n=1 Tax=Paenibacillus sp. FJAT-27812 TaxID=1684143 RepID=UPI0006A765C8|nr:Ger(x)C family spore germination protein [Paenibacillus sp. FJAT-27812]
MLHLINRTIIFVLAFILLSGCWGRREVNDIAIVAATGVDLVQNNLIRVTLLLAVPRLVGTSSSNDGGDSGLEATAGWVVSEEGETVTEVFQKLQKKLSRKIFFSHNRIIVIGESLAMHGMFPITDFFIRNRQSQLKSYVIVTKSEASDLLSYKPKFEKLVSEVIRGELKMNVGSSVQLSRFLAMLTDVGQEAYAPLISIAPPQKWVANSTSLMVSKGAAIFQEDRLIGWLNETETMALLWIRNEMKDGVVAVNVPEELGGGHVIGEISSVKSKISPIEGNGALKMAINISSSLTIIENTTKLDLKSASNRKMLNRLFTDAVKKRVEMLCAKVQKKLHSDVFGFGQAIYQQDPQSWNKYYSKNWSTLFPDIKVDILAKLKVVQTGLLEGGSTREDIK